MQQKLEGARTDPGCGDGAAGAGAGARAGVGSGPGCGEGAAVAGAGSGSGSASGSGSDSGSGCGDGAAVKPGKAGVHPKLMPSLGDPNSPAGHMPSVAPRTGHIIASAVAEPAHDDPGFSGSQAVHSQKPKLSTSEVKATTLDSPPAFDPNCLAACKQQTLAFQCA